MEYISLGEAFAHCAKSTSYWVWLVIAFLVFVGVAFTCIKKYQAGDLEGKEVVKFILVPFVAFVFALLFRPTEVANNTTKEQAARGVYIGY